MLRKINIYCNDDIITVCDLNHIRGPSITYIMRYQLLVEWFYNQNADDGKWLTSMIPSYFVHLIWYRSHIQYACMCNSVWLACHGNSCTPSQSVELAFGRAPFGCCVSYSVININIIWMQYAKYIVSAFMQHPALFLPMVILLEQWI